tara:strand:- start:71 stop:334 length:264 start_codon:yes stop_codon:yes gene_type:complete
MRVLLVLLLASATSSGSITSTLLERAARENYSTQKNSFERERIRREIKAKGETHQSVLKTMSTTAAIVVRIVGIDAWSYVVTELVVV